MHHRALLTGLLLLPLTAQAELPVSSLAAQGDRESVVSLVAGTRAVALGLGVPLHAFGERGLFVEGGWGHADGTARLAGAYHWQLTPYEQVPACDICDGFSLEPRPFNLALQAGLDLWTTPDAAFTTGVGPVIGITASLGTAHVEGFINASGGTSVVFGGATAWTAPVRGAIGISGRVIRLRASLVGRAGWNLGPAAPPELVHEAIASLGWEL